MIGFKSKHIKQVSVQNFNRYSVPTVINPFKCNICSDGRNFFINEGELNTQTFESNLILRSIVLRASAAVSRVFSRREGLWGQV